MSKFDKSTGEIISGKDDGCDHSKTCAYRYQGEYCNRLGTMSRDTKGGGPWYCRDHFFGRDIGPATSKKDWREELIDSKIKPEDYRQQGESKSDYTARMMGNMVIAINKVTSLPYDKDTLLG